MTPLPGQRSRVVSRLQRVPFEWPGPPVSLAGEEAVVAIGDVHGRLDLCIAMHEAIDLAFATGPAPLEVYLGDIVDRGPDSAGVIDVLIARQVARRVVVVRGNHEEMLLAALSGRATRRWLSFGGLETLRSYVGAAGPEGVDPEVWRRGFPDAHRDFIEAMVSRIDVGDLICIHDPNALAISDRGRPVVHGHHATERVRLMGRHLNVDSGAYATGRLTALVHRNGAFELWSATIEG